MRHRNNFSIGVNLLDWRVYIKIEKQSIIMCYLLIFSRSFFKHALFRKYLEVRFHILSESFVIPALFDMLKYPAVPFSSSNFVILLFRKYQHYRVYFIAKRSYSLRVQWVVRVQVPAPLFPLSPLSITVATVRVHALLGFLG